ncbi:MAG: site-2 protease family protein [Clostridiales bacterium]|nr:site-2 protease family protein [Clostridiales bacterium]
MHYLTNLWNTLDFGTLRDAAVQLLAVLFCLTVHETCHGLAALALGDPTAKRQHRLSLNPLRHIDWFGLLMMLVAGFGWARPVPVNPNYFKKPRQGMALTALAGPASNLLLALLLLIPARLIYTYAHYSVFNQTALDFLTSTAALSIGLGLFNLIPIPPLDGSKVLAVLLPERAYRWLMRYERFGIFALWLLVALGVGGRYMSLAIRWVYTLFCRIVGF